MSEIVRVKLLKGIEWMGQNFASGTTMNLPEHVVHADPSRFELLHGDTTKLHGGTIEPVESSKMRRGYEDKAR